MGPSDRSLDDWRQDLKNCSEVLLRRVFHFLFSTLAVMCFAPPNSPIMKYCPLQGPSNELDDHELAVQHNKPIPRISLLSQAFCFSDGKASNTTGNKIKEDYQT